MSDPMELKVFKCDKAIRWMKTAGWIAGSAAVITFFALLPLAWFSKCQPLMYALAISWAVIPPAWFWYEFFFIYRKEGWGNPRAFEAYKHGQQVSAAIWLAIAATLGAIASSDHFKETKAGAVQPQPAAGQQHP